MSLAARTIIYKTGQNGSALLKKVYQMPKIYVDSTLLSIGPARPRINAGPLSSGDEIHRYESGAAGSTKRELDPNHRTS